MKKKILTIVLVVLSLLCGMICLSACSESENADNSSSSNIEDSSSGHVHAFILQKNDSEYLKTAATCTAKAVYYYSCECGEKGTETFEYGELAAHTYSATWKYNDTHHWQEATCGCKVTQNYAEHSLNTDDVCTICNLSAIPTEGISYALSSDGTYYVVNDYSGTSPIVTIAESYNGLPVKGIFYSAFYDNTTVTDVIIPSSVTAINGSAFRGCRNLININIPDSVTSIGSYAFDGCDKLIVKDKGVHYVDKWIVGADSGLTFVKITEEIRGIADFEFEYCAIETAIIPTCAIDYITNNRLKTVTITSGDSIGARAFYNCPSLTSVTIPDSVTSIGSYAFYNCSSLTSITIPDGVTSIGEDAFRYCTSLTSITIPDGVTSIGEDAFV